MGKKKSCPLSRFHALSSANMSVISASLASVLPLPLSTSRATDSALETLAIAIRCFGIFAALLITSMPQRSCPTACSSRSLS
jgi:hypothetical protein